MTVATIPKITSLTAAAEALTELATPDFANPDVAWTGLEHRLWDSAARAATVIRSSHTAAGAALLADRVNWPPDRYDVIARGVGYSTLPFLVTPATPGPRHTYWAPMPDDIDVAFLPRLGFHAVTAAALAVLADACRTNIAAAAGQTRRPRRERAALRTEAGTYAVIRDRAAPLAVELTATLVDQLDTGPAAGATIQPMPVRLRS